MNKYDTSAIPYLHVGRKNASYLVKTSSRNILFRRGMEGNVSIIDAKTSKVLEEINHQESLDLVTWILNTRF
jgi:uncharacterized FlaG/YvyC family protein